MKSIKTFLGAGLLSLSGLAMLAMSPAALAADNRFTITYSYGDYDHYPARVVYYQPRYNHYYKYNKRHHRRHGYRHHVPWYARHRFDQGSHYRDRGHHDQHKLSQYKPRGDDHRDRRNRRERQDGRR